MERTPCCSSTKWVRFRGGLPVTHADCWPKRAASRAIVPIQRRRAILSCGQKACESNEERRLRLPIRGEKRGKIRPASTISRDVMRACASRQAFTTPGRQAFVGRSRANRKNRLLASSITAWLSPDGLRRACRETVRSRERETGLEPATACLGSRISQECRPLVIRWLCRLFYRKYT